MGKVKVATVMSTPHLDLIANKDYFMALAHLVPDDPEYREFFRTRDHDRAFVLMDNGVVETGVPMPIEQLIEIGDSIDATEMILPDSLGNKDATLHMGTEALAYIAHNGLTGYRFMAVPQGETLQEWLECLLEMKAWPINAIGISRFCPVPRAQAIYEAWERDLFPRWLDVHLLGCKGDPNEVAMIERGFPHLNLRGVDSAYPLYYALEGVHLPAEDDPVPRKEIDFHGARADSTLLASNVQWWEYRARGIL